MGEDTVPTTYTHCQHCGGPINILRGLGNSTSMPDAVWSEVVQCGCGKSLIQRTGFARGQA